MGSLHRPTQLSIQVNKQIIKKNFLKQNGIEDLDFFFQLLELTKDKEISQSYPDKLLPEVIKKINKYR